jgi:hypothetical protein
MVEVSDTIILVVVLGGILCVIGSAGVLGFVDMKNSREKTHEISRRTNVVKTDDGDRYGGPFRMRRLMPYFVACLVILGMTGFFSYRLYVAAGSSVAQQDFTGFAALFGLIAVTAGALAVVFTFPTFGSWLTSVFRNPDMQLEVALAPNRFTAPSSVIPTITTKEFYIQAKAFNGGKGTLKGGVANICVPAGCEIEVLDDQRKNHCAAPLPLPLLSFVNPTTEGDPTDVAFSTAWDDMESQMRYVFNVKITVREAQTCRVIFLVNGDPPIPENKAICRVDVPVSFAT